MPDHEEKPELTPEQKLLIKALLDDGKEPGLTPEEELLLKIFPDKITREELLQDAREKKAALDLIVLHLDPEEVKKLREASEED